MRSVPLSPLHEVSQRKARRRTDTKLTQLKKEAEKQAQDDNIVSTFGIPTLQGKLHS